MIYVDSLTIILQQYISFKEKKIFYSYPQESAFKWLQKKNFLIFLRGPCTEKKKRGENYILLIYCCNFYFTSAQSRIKSQLILYTYTGFFKVANSVENITPEPLFLSYKNQTVATLGNKTKKVTNIYLGPTKLFGICVEKEYTCMFYWSDEVDIF